jgi:hypothetical protein
MQLKIDFPTSKCYYSGKSKFSIAFSQEIIEVMSQAIERLTKFDTPMEQ